MLCSGPSNAKVTCLTWNVWSVGAFPSELGGENEVDALVCGLLQGYLMPEQFFNGGDEQQLLLRPD